MSVPRRPIAERFWPKVDKQSGDSTQALANLQALMGEMVGATFDWNYVPSEQIADLRRWIDKLGTAIADLQEVKP
jgi:hypothetical protein